MHRTATNGDRRAKPFKRVARVLSGLTYGRHVASVALAVVIGFATGLGAIGFRELSRFFNLILLERVWTWAEATLPYGRAALPLITGGGGLAVGLLFRKDAYAAYTRKTAGRGPKVVNYSRLRGGLS